MPEYIERENLFKFLTEQMTRKQNGAFAKGFNKGIMVARAAVHNKEITPSAGVVEVVRCKECVQYKDAEDWKGNIHKCCYLRADICLFEREPNDFCSYGERKDKTSLPEDIKQTVLDNFMKGSED